jgi:hypothetical protein
VWMETRYGIGSPCLGKVGDGTITRWGKTITCRGSRRAEEDHVPRKKAKKVRR